MLTWILSIASQKSANPYRNCSTMPVHLGFARSAGRPAERLGASSRLPCVLLGALAASIWLPCALLGALAASIWPRLVRSGCHGRPDWLDLPALAAPGRSGCVELVANECPIDAMSKTKRFAYRRPASTLPASLALQRCFMPQT